MLLCRADASGLAEGTSESLAERLRSLVARKRLITESKLSFSNGRQFFGYANKRMKSSRSIGGLLDGAQTVDGDLVRSRVLRTARFSRAVLTL